MKHRGLGPTPRLPESGGLRAENLHFEQGFRCHCCCCCWSENHLPRVILHLAGGTRWPREVGEVPKQCLTELGPEEPRPLSSVLRCGPCEHGRAGCKVLSVPLEGCCTVLGTVTWDPTHSLRF